MSNRDWVGFTFKAIEQAGENIAISYARLPAGENRADESAEVAWFELPHNEYDGVSGLHQLLQQHQVTAPASHTYRGSAPTLGKYLSGFMSTLRDAGIRQQQWRDFDRSRANRIGSPAERIAWRVFSAADTSVIVAAARAAGVSVNSWLLAHLDAAIRDGIAVADSDTAWVVPVNLRGVIERANPKAPNMSFWVMRGQPGDGPQVFQQQADRLKQKGYHFGTWMLFNAGKWFGEKAVLKDVSDKEKGNHSWTGTFSNLGAWQLSDDRPWVFNPNVSRANPVAAGCLTTNGRLALSLQLHGALNVSQVQCQQLLMDWAERCHQGVVEAEPDQVQATPA